MLAIDISTPKDLAHDQLAIADFRRRHPHMGVATICYVVVIRASLHHCFVDRSNTAALLGNIFSQSTCWSVKADPQKIRIGMKRPVLSRHGVDMFSGNFVKLTHSHKRSDRALGSLLVHHHMIRRVVPSTR
jgi:hypothetical protein